MERSDLVQTLLSIDEEAWLEMGERNPKPSIVIVGGAAFLLRNLTSRHMTHDIDVYRAEQALSHIISRYPNVNGMVASFADQIPYNFEDRLKKLDIESKAIEYLTPSLEDLIVMKLYAMRPNDLQDIDGAAAKGMVNWALLETLVYSDNEARASSLSERRYAEMTKMFERYKEKWVR